MASDSIMVISAEDSDVNIGIWIGAIGGSLIGILGGVFGTYCSIRNTKGPRERAFMIKAAVYCWIFVSAFLAGLFLISQPYNMLLWVVYPMLLIGGIFWCNQTQARIRAEEGGAGDMGMTDAIKKPQSGSQ